MSRVRPSGSGDTPSSNPLQACTEVSPFPAFKGNVEVGNPPDAPKLLPAIERVARRATRMPKAATADRGYGETAVGEALSTLGVRTVVLPTKGKPSASRRAVESRPHLQRLVKWRTGSEGRISCLKRDFGWNRTQIDGIEEVRTWCSYWVTTW